MPHIDELTMMMYIDRELSAEENLKAASHLLDCSVCQETLAKWQREQSFFCHSFTQEPEAVHIELAPSTLIQIDAIAQLHKSYCRKFAYRFYLVLSAAIGIFVYLALYFQGWMYEWIKSVWQVWRHTVIWASTLWLRENADSLFSLPDIYSVSVMFIFLLCCLIFLNIYKNPYGHWDESKGVSKK